jgi:2-oxoacid:acceptor oxidoreductase delta subunit (pyruvate/2-ketoisovalerate family)
MIPAGDAAKIVDAISVLRSMEGEDKPMLGRRVVVYGGGNTAIDVARTAKRMGAEPLIVYRRTRDNAGARLRGRGSAAGRRHGQVAVDHQAGRRVITDHRERWRLDEQGLPAADRRVRNHRSRFAGAGAGQDVDLGLLDGVPGLQVSDGVVKVGTNMMTGHPGIFAGGDMVPAERNVTVGIGHGKKAARTSTPGCAASNLCPAAKTRSRSVREPEHLVLHRRAENRAPDARHHPSPIDLRRSPGRPRRGQALFEARRCLSCGNCFECDNCYGVCPDNAVIKLGPGKRFEFNYDYCKGCGMCVAECPCGAIKMEAEEI